MAGKVFNENPSDLFRFVNLRRAIPKREREDKKQIRFIRTETQSKLHDDMAALAGSESAYGSMKQLAYGYKKGSHFINDLDSLEKHIPKLNDFSQWMKSSRDNLTVADASKALRGIIGNDGIDINPSQAEKEILWDSLYTQIMLSNNVKALFLISNSIKTLNIVEKLNDSSIQLTDTILGELFKAKVLIPDWMYKTLEEIRVDTDEGIGILPSDRSTKKERQEKRMDILKRISAARKAISTIRKNRGKDGFGLDDPITLDEYETLPQDVKDTFGGMDGGSPTSPPSTPLDEIDKDLTDFAADTANDYNEDNQIKEVQIGNSIIQMDNLCADMVVEHDCGAKSREIFPVLPFKNYASAIYVGDLLVTKQYLKKYDLGEVAHIEAVIKGLEKERTHRRLNRTETTTYFERETTNENERETQTTDRFSMEKESQRVVSKDMQISTGVNISANYGMMNIQSSTGFGYGTSQQSSTSEATSISKEVTDRALTRVKERIKESELVNIIREVEETAIHSIKNAHDTANHMNGVYRWVNKVYLNKILGYGQRRMMEFTIPEPANFYLFRKMVEPQSSSRTVLKPTHPKDYILPTGSGIKSFRDIKEDNYAQVMADYGVENVVPPSTESHVIGIKLEVDLGSRHHEVNSEAQVKVPNGYEVTHYRFMANWHASDSNYGIDVHVGYASKSFRSSNDSSRASDNYPLNEWREFNQGYYYSDHEIPVAVKVWGKGVGKK